MGQRHRVDRLPQPSHCRHRKVHHPHEWRPCRPRAVQPWCEEGQQPGVFPYRPGTRRRFHLASATVNPTLLTQYFSLGDEHNRHMDDAEDFSTEFLVCTVASTFAKGGIGYCTARPSGLTTLFHYKTLSLRNPLARETKATATFATSRRSRRTRHSVGALGSWT